MKNKQVNCESAVNDIVIEVDRCMTCPFATYTGTGYCVKSARAIVVDHSIPEWCQLKKNGVHVKLR